MLTGILALNVAVRHRVHLTGRRRRREIAGLTAATAATLVGVLGLFNGGGRVFWAWLSDRIGRMRAFMGMLGLQAICFFSCRTPRRSRCSPSSPRWSTWLRRRLRHDAGDRGRLLRHAERGRHLRRDDRGVEHRRRGRPAAAGRAVRVQRQLHAGVHGHRDHRAGVAGAAAGHAKDAVRAGVEGDRRSAHLERDAVTAGAAAARRRSGSRAPRRPPAARRRSARRRAAAARRSPPPSAAGAGAPSPGCAGCRR